MLQCLQKRTRCSRKVVKRSIESKGCLRNGRIERFSSFRVRAHERIAFRIIEKPQWKVVYEDRWFLVYEKPPFAICEGTEFIHRLDKESSGLVMVAKSPDVKTRFIALFKEQQVHKEYVALIEGAVRGAQGTIKRPIALIERGIGFKRMGISSKGGKTAVTHWKLLCKKGAYAALSFRIETGRTHQIRVHCASMNWSILGDHTYGTSRASVRRMCLHATKLSFIHPFTKQQCLFQSPSPWDEKSLSAHSFV